MNNNPNNQNDNNIDDILDILQKRKAQDIMNGTPHDGAPTRIDNSAVKKDSAPKAPSIQQANNTSGAYKPASVQGQRAASSALPPVSATPNVPKTNPVQSVHHAPIQAQGAPRNDATKQVPVNMPSQKPKAPAAMPSSHVQQSSNARPVSSPRPSAASMQKAPSAISLSDFDDKEVEKANLKAVKKKNKKKRGVPGWLKVIVYLILVISVSVLISVTTIKVGNDVFAFVKSDKEITIHVDENATLTDIAATLEQADIIEYPWIFEKYARSRIKSRSYLTEDFLAGEYVLKPSMNYDKLIAALCVSAYDKSVVRITIPEGYTFNDILELFIKEGVMKKEDKEEYLKQLQEFPYEYNFITKLDEQGSFDNADRIHRLEGYLFPDTYDFYKNENPVAAIDKLLSNFENKFSEEMYQRANELGMTVDEIITLASIIEAEGDSPANFAKISSVFHNRLNDRSGKFNLLGSDATTLYALRIAGHDKKTLGKDDTDFVHPYNTYTSKGLPPGPICNPGTEAIYAALYPDSTNYFYFLTMANGETVFAQTASQHDANIAKSNRLAAEMKAE